MTQILKLKYGYISVLFILNFLLSPWQSFMFLQTLGKFQMIVISLIWVKFKLNKMSEMNLMDLRLMLQQCRSLASMEGHINSFWTVCHLGRWQSAKPTEGSFPGSSIRLVSKLLLTLLTLSISSFLSPFLHFPPLPDLTSVSVALWTNLVFDPSLVSKGLLSSVQSYPKKLYTKF